MGSQEGSPPTAWLGGVEMKVICSDGSIPTPTSRWVTAGSYSEVALHPRFQVNTSLPPRSKRPPALLRDLPALRIGSSRRCSSGRRTSRLGTGLTNASPRSHTRTLEDPRTMSPRLRRSPCHGLTAGAREGDRLRHLGQCARADQPTSPAPPLRPPPRVFQPPASQSAPATIDTGAQSTRFAQRAWHVLGSRVGEGQGVSSSFVRVPHCAKLASPAAEPWRSGLLSLRSEFDPEHAFDLRDKELGSSRSTSSWPTIEMNISQSSGIVTLPTGGPSGDVRKTSSSFSSPSCIGGHKCTECAGRSSA